MNKLPLYCQIKIWFSVKNKIFLKGEMHGTSSGGLILSAALRDDSVGDVGVNGGGDKPLIHYRLIEVNIENSLSRLTASLYDYICGGCKKSPRS